MMTTKVTTQQYPAPLVKPSTWSQISSIICRRLVLNKKFSSVALEWCSGSCMSLQSATRTWRKAVFLVFFCKYFLGSFAFTVHCMGLSLDRYGVLIHCSHMTFMFFMGPKSIIWWLPFRDQPTFLQCFLVRPETQAKSGTLFAGV